MRLNYQKLSMHVCLVLLTGLLLGYMIPIAISHSTFGYTRQDLMDSIHKTAIDQKNKDLFRQRNAMATAITQKITDLKTNFNQQPLQTTLAEIKNYETLLHKVLTEPNIRLTAFIDSRISLMWPVLLSSLFMICFIIIPYRIKKMQWGKFFGLFAIVATIMFVPNELRNSADFGSEGRVIFSVFNKDVNIHMYRYQLFLYALTIIVLVIVWLKSEQEAKQAAAYRFDEYTFEGITTDLADLKAQYYRWQIFSIALFAVFGSLLYHFYHIVFIEGDGRYLFQAVVFNFLYLFTWVLGSLPLYFKFRNWDTFKQRILYDKSTEKLLEENNIEVTELRKFIPPYEIASSVNQGVSIMLSAVSFFLPLLKILTQR